MKVQLGKPLPWNVRDEHCNLLLARGHVIESEHQLEALLERGAFVDIEEAKAVHSHHAVSATASVQSPVSLFGVWDKRADELHKVLANAPNLPELELRLTAFADSLMDAVDKDTDISLYRVIRQESEDAFFYGFSHAVHASVLCLLVARRLQWSHERATSLVKAALTMNMTLHDLQHQLVRQDVPMRDSQKAQIHRHPQEALEWLTKAGVTDVDWLTAVAQHHEKPDGSGYPNGLVEVSELAHCLRMVDVFLAKISLRTERAALTIQEATKQLFHEDQHRTVANAIFQELGLFPPGELVKLANGECGVVMHRTDNVKYPIVAAITDCQGKPCARTTQRDTSCSEFAIIASIPEKTLAARLPPERIYGFANVAGGSGKKP